MAKFKSLSTFAEVEKWDKEAELEIFKIVSQIQQLDCEINHCQNTFSRTILQSSLLRINHKYKMPLENIANKLQEAIDFTPNSLNDKKDLLKELKSKKKELQLQKREVAVNIKVIRKTSRIESVNAGRMIFRYSSKIAAYERRAIRYRKEAQLQPYEDSITAIERQPLQIDKDIFWVESISN